MRSHFTKVLCTIIIAIGLLGSEQGVAQTLHTIETSGTTWVPNTLSISLGDTVRWSNASGFHNVNGTEATFPDNPEFFGNSVGQDWVFTHVFETVGNYDFQCDPHAGLGMTGTITVSSTTGVDGQNPSSIILTSYPVPSSDNVTLEISEMITSEDLGGVVYDLMGREVFRIDNLDGPLVSIDVSSWPRASYVFKLIDGEEVVASQRLLVR